MLRLSYILLLVAVLGCGGSNAELGEKPANLVSEEKMAQMLARVHINEARVAKHGYASADSNAILFNRLQTQNLAKFDVDTAAYTQSYIYYSARPDRLTRIYEQVIELLKAEQQKKQKALVSKKPTA
jgi:hypothetical protein